MVEVTQPLKIRHGILSFKKCKCLVLSFTVMPCHFRPMGETEIFGGHKNSKNGNAAFLNFQVIHKARPCLPVKVKEYRVNKSVITGRNGPRGVSWYLASKNEI